MQGGSPDVSEVTVTVPGLLARFTDERQTFALRAETLDECLDRLIESYPAIEPHLFDGAGDLRPHVRLFHNGTGVELGEAASVGLDDGDEVLVLQAVSGG